MEEFTTAWHGPLIFLLHIQPRPRFMPSRCLSVLLAFFLGLSLLCKWAASLLGHEATTSLRLFDPGWLAKSLNV